jgi:hypothetical protein
MNRRRLDVLLDDDSKARWSIFVFSIAATALAGFVADLSGVSVKIAGIIACISGGFTLIWQVLLYVSASTKTTRAERSVSRDFLKPAASICVIFLALWVVSKNSTNVRSAILNGRLEATLASNQPIEQKRVKSKRIIDVASETNVQLEPRLVRESNLQGTNDEKLGVQFGSAASSYIAEIRSAKSSDDLSASLEQLTAFLRDRSAAGENIDKPELDKIALSVSSASYMYPALPQVWKTASVVVNYRVNRDQTYVKSLPNCWDTMKGHWEEPDKPMPPNTFWADDQFMGNCELTLDDGPSFRESGFGKAYEHNLTRGHVQLRLNVHDASIVYSGGSLIPFSHLQCVRCTFHVNATQAPPPTGQKIMDELLTADLKDVSLVGDLDGQGS